MAVFQRFVNSESNNSAPSAKKITKVLKKGERSVQRRFFLPWMGSFSPLGYLRSFLFFVFRIRSTAASIVSKIPQRVCCRVEQNWVHP